MRLWNWNMPKKKREHEKHAVGQFKSFVKHQENGTHAFECCTENYFVQLYVCVCLSFSTLLTISLLKKKKKKRIVSERLNTEHNFKK